MSDDCGLLALDPDSGQHVPLVRGAHYRVDSHCEETCTPGHCPGLVDRGTLTYVGSRYLYTDRLFGAVWRHSFRQAGGTTLDFDDQLDTLFPVLVVAPQGA